VLMAMSMQVDRAKAGKGSDRNSVVEFFYSIHKLSELQPTSAYVRIYRSPISKWERTESLER
jgi:hypothetical protein